MTDLPYVYQRLRSLGYSHRTARRLALWVCDPDQPVNV